MTQKALSAYVSFWLTPTEALTYWSIMLGLLTRSGAIFCACWFSRSLQCTELWSSFCCSHYLSSLSFSGWTTDMCKFAYLKQLCLWALLLAVWISLILSDWYHCKCVFSVVFLCLYSDCWWFALLTDSFDSPISWAGRSDAENKFLEHSECLQYSFPHLTTTCSVLHLFITYHWVQTDTQYWYSCCEVDPVCIDSFSVVACSQLRGQVQTGPDTEKLCRWSPTSYH